MPLCRLVFTFPPSCSSTRLVLLPKMHHVKATAVAFPTRSRSRPGRMDPRRRRFVTIAFVTLVLFLLYTYAGHPSSVSSAVQAGLDYFLHVPDLPAANATLGVRLDHREQKTQMLTESNSLVPSSPSPNSHRFAATACCWQQTSLNSTLPYPINPYGPMQM